MYQLNISVSNEKSHWFYAMEKVLSIKIKKFYGILATKVDKSRLYISIACENKYKKDIAKVLKECIVEMYLTTVKLEYLSKILLLPKLKSDAYKILLHTLVVFDREKEEEIVLSSLRINNNLALDGLFNFKLTELKSRWNEIADLARNNAQYLTNDDTLNELLKFLMSAVSPKIKKLEVVINQNEYNIKGEYKEGLFEYKALSTEQLMVYLINVAPLELTLKGDFNDQQLYKRLTSIFDAKSNANYMTNLNF